MVCSLLFFVSCGKKKKENTGTEGIKTSKSIEVIYKKVAQENLVIAGELEIFSFDFLILDQKITKIKINDENAMLLKRQDENNPRDIYVDSRVNFTVELYVSNLDPEISLELYRDSELKENFQVKLLRN